MLPKYFAAALQDYDWAEIVGMQTYGKGIVQYIIPFATGSAIKLTSAKYFTPNGKCIHGLISAGYKSRKWG